MYIYIYILYIFYTYYVALPCMSTEISEEVALHAPQRPHWRSESGWMQRLRSTPVEAAKVFLQWPPTITKSLRRVSWPSTESLGPAWGPTFGVVGLNTREILKQWDHDEDVSTPKTVFFTAQSALKTKKILRANILIESRKRGEISRYKQTNKTGKIYSKIGIRLVGPQKRCSQIQRNVREARTKISSDRWEINNTYDHRPMATVALPMGEGFPNSLVSKLRSLRKFLLSTTASCPPRSTTPDILRQAKNDSDSLHPPQLPAPGRSTRIDRVSQLTPAPWPQVLVTGKGYPPQGLHLAAQRPWGSLWPGRTGLNLRTG